MSSLKEKLQTIWENKESIADGFYHAYIHCTPEIEAEAIKRLNLCRKNTCGLHDPNGTSEKAVLKGSESCAGCGCVLKAKTHSMSNHCWLKNIGQTPIWDAVLTEEQDKEMQELIYNNQFKK